MNFKKFRDVNYLKRLLDKKREELQFHKQKSEDISWIKYILSLWATPSFHLRQVERDLENQRALSENQIEELEIIIEELEGTIKEMRGNGNNEKQ